MNRCSFVFSACFRTLSGLWSVPSARIFFFFFNDTATTEIYTLSLHDALPISDRLIPLFAVGAFLSFTISQAGMFVHWHRVDRKSTRLNSSHLVISYAVFCLKKKKRYIPPLSSRRYTISAPHTHLITAINAVHI